MRFRPRSSCRSRRRPDEHLRATRQRRSSSCTGALGRTSVASGLARLALRAGLRVVTLAHVVLQLVHDHSAADDGVGARQRDLCAQETRRERRCGRSGNARAPCLSVRQRELGGACNTRSRVSCWRAQPHRSLLAQRCTGRAEPRPRPRTVSGGGDVAQVARVALRVARRAVRLARWVEVGAWRRRAR